MLQLIVKNLVKEAVRTQIMLFTANILMSLFLLQPMAEYWMHRFIHAIRLPYHVVHHKNYGSGMYHSYTGDLLAWILIVVLLVTGHHWWALAVCKYEFTHVLSHLDTRSKQYSHHRMHHRIPNCNYSFSAVWPDKLFGTYKSEVE